MRMLILAFALGVLWVQTSASLPSGWGLAVPGTLLCLLASRSGGRARSAFGLVGVFLLGAGYAAGRAEVRLSDALPAVWEGRDIHLHGRVAGMPGVFDAGQRFLFEVESVSTAGASVPSRLQLSWYRSASREAGGGVEAPALPELAAGQRWSLVVRLKRPHGNLNPGGFDYEGWLLERGIRATGSVRQGERLADEGWRPGEAVDRQRQRVRGEFATRLPAEAYPWVGVLVALAIGEQQAIPAAQWAVFNRTGTTHLMSISGLHLTLVAALFGSLVAWAWRRLPGLATWRPAQQAGLLAGAGVAVGVAFFSGFGIPAQRTLYMILVAVLALLSGRLVAPSRVLAWALLTVLLIDPWAVIAPGFWLSFGTVAALLLASSAWVGEARGWRARWQAWGRAQWVATLATLPVLLLVFQQFSLVSPLANLLAIPVVSLGVTPLVLLAVLVPGSGALELAHAGLSVLMSFLAWCAGGPQWTVAAPPFWAVALAGLGVAGLLLPAGVPGRWLGGLLVVPLLGWPGERLPPGEARITVLDVGQGLSVVVQTASHTLLYDPGPRYGGEADAGQRVVVPFLRAQGVAALDQLVVSHHDVDHAGGLDSVRAALPVARLVGAESVPGERCHAGQRWSWDGVDFEVIHPLPSAYAAGLADNHLSCVLRVSAAGQRILLTGDIESPDEAALLARDQAALAADVLLVPHHGSKTSSTLAFLRAVGAREAVIPVGYHNRFRHPAPPVLRRLDASGVRVWRTDQDGAVRVDLQPGGVAVSGWRAAAARYWHLSASGE